jgi:hypothetical protein
MKKKELVLAAVTMPNGEFKVLRQERKRLLNEQITDQESWLEQKTSWLPYWRFPSMQLQREQRGVFRSV